PPKMIMLFCGGAIAMAEWPDLTAGATPSPECSNSHWQVSTHTLSRTSGELLRSRRQTSLSRINSLMRRYLSSQIINKIDLYCTSAISGVIVLGCTIDLLQVPKSVTTENDHCT